MLAWDWFAILCINLNIPVPQPLLFSPTAAPIYPT